MKSPQFYLTAIFALVFISLNAQNAHKLNWSDEIDIDPSKNSFLAFTEAGTHYFIQRIGSKTNLLHLDKDLKITKEAKLDYGLKDKSPYVYTRTTATKKIGIYRNIDGKEDIYTYSTSEFNNGSFGPFEELQNYSFQYSGFANWSNNKPRRDVNGLFISPNGEFVAIVNSFYLKDKQHDELTQVTVYNSDLEFLWSDSVTYDDLKDKLNWRWSVRVSNNGEVYFLSRVLKTDNHNIVVRKITESSNEKFEYKFDADTDVLAERVFFYDANNYDEISVVGYSKEKNKQEYIDIGGYEPTELFIMHWNLINDSTVLHTQVIPKESEIVAGLSNFTSIMLYGESFYLFFDNDVSSTTTSFGEGSTTVHKFRDLILFKIDSTISQLEYEIFERSLNPEIKALGNYKISTYNDQIQVVLNNNANNGGRKRGMTELWTIDPSSLEMSSEELFDPNTDNFAMASSYKGYVGNIYDYKFVAKTKGRKKMKFFTLESLE